MNVPPPTEKQSRLMWLAITGLAIAVIIALLVGVVWGLGQVLRILAPVLWPLAVAGVLAYLLDPVVDFFERRKLSRKRAVVCVFGLVLVIVLGFCGSVVPQLVQETRELTAKVPDYSRRLQERAEEWVAHPPEIVRRFFKPAPALPPVTDGAAVATTNDPAVGSSGTNAPLAVADNGKPAPGNALSRDTLRSAANWLTQSLPELSSWLFGQMSRVAGWFGVLMGLALIPIYTFYLLLEKRVIESRWTDYLPIRQSGFKDELVFVIRAINGYLIAFFRGQVLVALCDGALYTAGFLIIGLPYAVLIGVMATVLTMIPFLGAITTCVVALIIALVQYGDWQHPALVLGVFAVVQTIEGLIISPKIMGDRVGLHPLTIIIAVIAGTTLLGGLLGGILAIPLTAALRVILGRYVWKRVPDQAGN